jgi:hypothetical protein
MATKLITATVVGTNGNAFNGGTLGAELLSSSNWTSTGWTGSYAAGWSHTTGNTTALTNTLAATTATYYQISVTVTNRTAGTFTVSFGGVTSSALSSTSNFSILSTSTGTLSIAPLTTFDGTIVVSIKTIGASTAVDWSFPVRNILLQDVSSLGLLCGSIPYTTQITDLKTGAIYCSTSLYADLTASANAGAGMYSVASVAGINSQVLPSVLTMAFPTTGIMARPITSVVIGATTCVTKIIVLATETEYYTSSTVANITSGATAVNLASVANIASENTQVFASAVTMGLPTDGISMRTIASTTIGSTACVTEITVLATGTKYYTSTTASSIVSAS